MRGRITLVSGSDQRIRSCTYASRVERQALINTWAKQYGHRFNSCFLHIAPDKFCGAIGFDGRNVRNDSPNKRYFSILNPERTNGGYSNTTPFGIKTI